MSATLIDVPDGHARGLHAEQLAAREFHARSLLFFRRARFQHQPRNRRNRRQRLAAKSQRRDRKQIVRRAQLRRCVPLERQQRIVVVHPAAVVDHANQPLAARFHFDANRARARIKRVLEQLLHHRRGPLDNLARGNLVRYIFREYAYPRHHQSSPVGNFFGMIRFTLQSCPEETQGDYDKAQRQANPPRQPQDATTDQPKSYERNRADHGNRPVPVFRVPLRHFGKESRTFLLNPRVYSSAFVMAMPNSFS